MSKFFVYCEFCNFKDITESTEGYVEVKRAKIPRGIPTFDPVEKKTKNKKSLDQTKMIKCPQCGRGVILKKLPKPYAEALKKQEKEDEQTED